MSDLSKDHTTMYMQNWNDIEPMMQWLEYDSISTPARLFFFGVSVLSYEAAPKWYVEMEVPELVILFDHQEMLADANGASINALNVSKNYRRAKQQMRHSHNFGRAHLSAGHAPLTNLASY